MHVSVVSLQSCLIFCNAMNGSPPSSSGPGFFRQNIGVSYRALLQGIFLTQEWKPILLCLLSWQAGSLPPCYLGSPLASVAAAAKICSTSLIKYIWIKTTLNKNAVLLAKIKEKTQLNWNNHLPLVRCFENLNPDLLVKLHEKRAAFTHCRVVK